MSKYLLLLLKYVYLLPLIILAAICVIIYVWVRKKSYFSRIIVTVLSLVLIGFTSWLMVVCIDLNKINKSALAKQCVNYLLLAPKDNAIKTIKDLDEHKVGYTLRDNNKIEPAALSRLFNKSVKLRAFKDYSDSLGDLAVGDISALLVSQPSYDLIKDVPEENYFSGLKTVKTFRVCGASELANKPNIKPDNSENDELPTAFNVYISGIDTSGPINTISRSDVNILATFNLAKHKILLTNTPRDTYLEIPGKGQNQKDKLTHAGIYGVSTSMAALSKLYDTPIQYYVRLNFSSFLKIIDVIGGVDVENSQEFVSAHEHFTFPKGLIHMDSAHALEFVRERYSFASGDLMRNQNQILLIEAVFNKIKQSPNLFKLHALAEQLGASLESNITLNDLAFWASKIIGQPDFAIERIFLTGKGQRDAPSFLMPNLRLYTMQPDEESLKQIRDQIKTTLD